MLAAIVVLGVACVPACRDTTPAPATVPGHAEAPGPPITPRVPDNVVIISIDTLRADRVGAYGWTRARTPALDALARAGTRFERAYATAPITLTSHASLLTGRYPPGHGARHNGMRVSGDVRTLAHTLAARGMATGAFIGAFPLDRRFGLAGGFADGYSDTMPRDDRGRARNERPGRVVMDEALAWLAARGTRPFFAWIHLFEPHAPYEGDSSPGGVGAGARSASDRYDDEVARADREVQRLIDALQARNDTTLVVATADHGESFGEHGEIGHSLFVYDTTLRVPLIVAAVGRASGGAGGRIVQAPVSLVDVVPTIHELLALPPPDADGTSLVAVMADPSRAPARALYAESFAPLIDFGWSALRSLRVDGQKAIAAPTPELFDLAADPGESTNIAATNAARLQALVQRIERLSPAELPRNAPVAQDAEARARLQALGYVATAPAPAQGTRPDPKDRRDLAARIAAVTSGELTGVALRDALTRIVHEDPRNAQMQMRLGFAWLEAGDCPAAMPHFRAAIDAQLPSADPYLGLAECEGAAGRAAAALATLGRAMTVEPGNPVVLANAGILELARNEPARAITRLDAALAIAPDLHVARFTLARAHGRLGHRADAAREATELLRRLPRDAPQRAEVQRLLDAVR